MMRNLPSFAGGREVDCANAIWPPSTPTARLITAANFMFASPLAFLLVCREQQYSIPSIESTAPFAGNASPPVNPPALLASRERPEELREIELPDDLRPLL